MESSGLGGVPILIVGAESETSRLQTFIRASGSSFSNAPIIQIQDCAGVKTELQARQNDMCLVLIALPQATMEWLELIRELNSGTSTSRAVAVVLSDAREVISASREHQQRFFLPLDQLTPNLLGDTIQTAWEHAHLQATNNRLQAMQNDAEQRFKDMADQFADWLWEIDTNLNLLFSSSRKRPTQGANPGQRFTTCFLPEEQLRIEDDFAALARDPKPFQDRDYWSMDAYGNRMCWAISGTPVLDAAGEIKGYRGVGKDVSAQKASTDQLFHLANHDQVTGVYNRQRFYDELGRSVRISKREKRPGALLLIDIDRFSYFNENYGHEVGDKLLVHFAQVVKDNLRNGDFLARTAGDEFALIMRDVAEDDVDYRVGRLLDSLRARPMMVEQGSLTYNVTIAVITFPEQADNADDLLNKAGYTLHKAKNKGRNRVEKFDNTIPQDKEGGRKLEWLDFVTECLNDEQHRMVIHFQPIVPLNDALKTKDFYEVLVRMVDQNGNLVPPTNFIETAEDFGVISKIDNIVTTRAIEVLEMWHKQGRKVHLSVNISAKNFDDDDFCQNIAKKLQESTFAEGSLVFEITETSLLRDMAAVRKFIDEMKQYGAGFALDDCGVGYSSFNYIRHLPLDFIKIDGSFIKNLHRNQEDEAFVEALNGVAKKMQILTVAEMVEEAETVEKLKKIGVDYAQGFYFASPGPDIPDDENVH